MKYLSGSRTTLCVLLAIVFAAIPACQRLGKRRTAAPTAGEEGMQSVPLLVLKGTDGATLALAPVYVDDQGPFAFALDTGASHSVIDEDLADQLVLQRYASQRAAATHRSRRL
jgi:hypothetical protein